MRSVCFLCFPLISKEFNEFLGFPWICMDFHAFHEISVFPLFSVACQRFQWILMVSIDLHGFLWISIASRWLRWIPWISLISIALTRFFLCHGFALCRQLLFAVPCALQGSALCRASRLQVPCTSHDCALSNTSHSAWLPPSEASALCRTLHLTVLLLGFCGSLHFAVLSHFARLYSLQYLALCLFSLRIIVRFTSLCVSNFFCTLQDFALCWIFLFPGPCNLQWRAAKQMKDCGFRI